MKLKDCLEFAAAHPVCYLATEEGDQPRVRPLHMWFADERGFYFMTMSPKSLSRQLHANPRVEICFFNGASELPDARTMRVSGQVEFVRDAGLARRVTQERAGLEEIICRPLEPVTEVFRVGTGTAWFWEPHDILREPDVERVTF